RFGERLSVGHDAGRNAQRRQLVAGGADRSALFLASAPDCVERVATESRLRVAHTNARGEAVPQARLLDDLDASSALGFNACAPSRARHPSRHARPHTKRRTSADRAIADATPPQRDLEMIVDVAGPRHRDSVPAKARAEPRTEHAARGRLPERVDAESTD